MVLQTKRILLTGGYGFLGKHVYNYLQSIGCTQVFRTRSSEFDLTREPDIRRLLMATRPEIVIHLAACVGGIGAHTAEPATFLYRNLIMGTQLVEACRLMEIEKFVAIGTICSYPKLTPVPFREEDLWAGYPAEATAPYGLAKKMLMVQLQTYRQQYGFPGVNLLLSNLYGPEDHFELATAHVVPALIRKCQDALDRGDQVLPVWGSGTATREFLYVDDAVRAIQLALERLDTSEPVNIGTGRETPIRELVELIAQKMDFKGEIRFQADKPDGQPRRWVDTGRAKKWLGFQAEITLSEGLDRTIAWYRQTRHTKESRRVA
jgi:GDP-L-fucose synthase